MSINVLLGITGGISAYKAADLASALVQTDYSVKVVMTKKAKEFITPLTLSTLSKDVVYDDEMEWAPTGKVIHIELAKWLDILVIAPATANTICKIAGGIADNLLTSIYLALPGDKKIVICPAMNNHMYVNKKTQDSLKILDVINISIVGPEVGLLACGDYGLGKISPTKTIVNEVIKIYR